MKTSTTTLADRGCARSLAYHTMGLWGNVLIVLWALVGSGLFIVGQSQLIFDAAYELNVNNVHVNGSIFGMDVDKSVDYHVPFTVHNPHGYVDLVEQLWRLNEDAVDPDGSPRSNFYPRLGASFLVAFSGVWPHLKLLLCLVFWFLPWRPKMRSRSLYVLDLLGKWSLFDVLIVCMLVAIFSLHISVPVPTASSNAIANLPAFLGNPNEVKNATWWTTGVCFELQGSSSYDTCTGVATLVMCDTENCTPPHCTDFCQGLLAQAANMSYAGEVDGFYIMRSRLGIYFFSAGVTVSLLLSFALNIIDETWRRRNKVFDDDFTPIDTNDLDDDDDGGSGDSDDVDDAAIQQKQLQAALVGGGGGEDYGSAHNGRAGSDYSYSKGSSARGGDGALTNTRRVTNSNNNYNTNNNNNNNNNNKMRVPEPVALVRYGSDEDSLATLGGSGGGGGASSLPLLACPGGGVAVSHIHKDPDVSVSILKKPLVGKRDSHSHGPPHDGYACLFANRHSKDRPLLPSAGVLFAQTFCYVVAVAVFLGGVLLPSATRNVHGTLPSILDPLVLNGTLNEDYSLITIAQMIVDGGGSNNFLQKDLIIFVFIGPSLLLLTVGAVLFVPARPRHQYWLLHAVHLLNSFSAWEVMLFVYFILRIELPPLADTVCGSTKQDITTIRQIANDFIYGGAPQPCFGLDLDFNLYTLLIPSAFVTLFFGSIVLLRLGNRRVFPFMVLQDQRDLAAAVEREEEEERARSLSARSEKLSAHMQGSSAHVYHSM